MKPDEFYYYQLELERERSERILVAMALKDSESVKFYSNKPS